MMILKLVWNPVSGSVVGCSLGFMCPGWLMSQHLLFQSCRAKCSMIEKNGCKGYMGLDFMLSFWTLFSAFIWTSESFQFWWFCAFGEFVFLCSKMNVIKLNVQCIVVAQKFDSVRKNTFYYQDSFWLEFVKTNFSICRHGAGELWDFCKPSRPCLIFLSPHRWMWNCRSDFWAFGCSWHPSLLHQYF